jgi:outer membrane protein OmpA-like peptidoglycan-associated protein
MTRSACLKGLRVLALAFACSCAPTPPAVSQVTQQPRRTSPADSHPLSWPDSDGDGVTDDVDRCPHDPGTDDSPNGSGCPRQRACVDICAGKKRCLRPPEEVHFAPGRSDLSEQGERSLARIVDWLSSTPEAVRVKLRGHATAIGPRGDPATEARLAFLRADRVRAWLVSQGVVAGRLESSADDASTDSAPSTDTVELSVIVPDQSDCCFAPCI